VKWNIDTINRFFSAFPYAGNNLMVADILIYAGSFISILWGGAHIAPVKSIVAGFGPISEDNRRIIAMEWVAEGLMLMFVGALAGLVVWFGGVDGPVSIIVLRALAAFLVVLAAWTFVTGARTSILPMKICPFVKTAVALLFLVGTASFTHGAGFTH